jgi:hypothetical protein
VTPKQRGRAVPTTTFADRERQALQSLALSVITDPKSTDADRAAARDRLTCDERALDLKRLTDHEVRLAVIAQRVLSHVRARARGDALDPLEGGDESPLAAYGVTALDLEELECAYPKPERAPVVKPETATSSASDHEQPTPAPTLVSLGLGRSR